jgi:hypothetical protein
MKADMHSVTVHDLSNVAHIYDESQVLHAAACIVRRQISDITISDDEYSAPEGVSILNYDAKLPSSLKTFMLDDSAFESANDNTSVPMGKLRKCLSLAECIVSVSKYKFTAFHLGLALQVHHIYGYKNLIEILHSHGLYASYHEVRHYLTSVANHEINKIEQGYIFLVESFQPMARPNLIQEGTENVDINAETIDGKDTFHAMARAVFQV